MVKILKPLSVSESDSRIYSCCFGHTNLLPKHDFCAEVFIPPILYMWAIDWFLFPIHGGGGIILITLFRYCFTLFLWFFSLRKMHSFNYKSSFSVLIFHTLWQILIGPLEILSFKCSQKFALNSPYLALLSCLWRYKS